MAPVEGVAHGAQIARVEQPPARRTPPVTLCRILQEAQQALRVYTKPEQHVSHNCILNWWHAAQQIRKTKIQFSLGKSWVDSGSWGPLRLIGNGHRETLHVSWHDALTNIA